MADIFISYHSADRPRAEALRRWFEECDWSVWIDREIGIGEGWEQRLQKELEAARLVVVLWSAQARRSEWVQREATAAAADGRLLQIHGTGVPLLPPFDGLQAVRMQSWSGESSHSEKARLLAAVASRLGMSPAARQQIDAATSSLPHVNYDLIASLELAFYYCARQVERRRHQQSDESQDQHWAEIRASFAGLLELLNADAPSADDDREGTLHRMVEDFLNQLELLAPDPGLVH